MRIGIIATEASGDRLAASIVKEWQKRDLTVQVEGIVGPDTEALGIQSWFPMERLSVMGLIEPLKRLPELWRIQRACIKQFLKNPPDVFIGIDSPDFTLAIEKKLRCAGIITVHIVSPSVWAWRPGRIHRIREAVSLMLPLFPFEQSFYTAKGIAAHCIGHPLADTIPLTIDTLAAKAVLGFTNKTVIALLPGSREAELRFMLPVYLKTAEKLSQKIPNAHFMIPLISAQHKKIAEEMVEGLGLQALSLTISVKNLSTLLPAADAVLVTAGTATLEVMLYKKPMVIAYKTDFFTYQIVKRLIQVPYIGLPNLLANAPIVPELIQDQVTTTQCTEAILQLLQQDRENTLQQLFTQIHHSLKKGAATQAVEKILTILT
ncbi:MAG: Lipid-A-disaccharide synthase [Pseudomonadota bacterium]